MFRICSLVATGTRRGESPRRVSRGRRLVLAGRVVRHENEAKKRRDGIRDAGCGGQDECRRNRVTRESAGARAREEKGSHAQRNRVPAREIISVRLVIP